MASTWANSPSLWPSNMGKPNFWRQSHSWSARLVRPAMCQLMEMLYNMAHPLGFLRFQPI